MGESARQVPQHIVPLAEFVKLRRAHEHKHPYSWIRDAKAGKLPGAFQFNGRGAWFVCLDAYDAGVQKLSAPKTPAPDDSLQLLADRLGLSPAEYATAQRAARG